MEAQKNTTPSLSLQFNGCEALLRFIDSDGRHFDVNISALARKMGEVRGGVLMQWIEDRRAEIAELDAWGEPYEPTRGKLRR
jgi:hypothetical protein